MVTGFKQELKKAGVQLFVGKTKTDVHRQGNMKMLTGDLLIRGVTRYLETAGLTDENKLDAFTAVAPMFRATRRSNKTKKTELIKVRLELTEGVTHVHNANHITNAVMQANFKALQKLATPNSTPTALHGCRARFATALKSSGSSELHMKKTRGMGKQLFLAMPTQLRRRRHQMSRQRTRINVWEKMKAPPHNPKAEVDAHAACGLPWLTRHEAPSHVWETRGKTCAMPSTKTSGGKECGKERGPNQEQEENNHLMK